jgi:hypothetical protein
MGRQTVQRRQRHRKYCVKIMFQIQNCVNVRIEQSAFAYAQKDKSAGRCSCHVKLDPKTLRRSRKKLTIERNLLKISLRFSNQNSRMLFTPLSLIKC